MIESLRPGWLLLLPAGLALLWAWWRLRAGAGPWRGLVDPELLAVLAARAPARSARLALGLALALLVLGCLALAGPAWREQSAVVHRDLSARIVVLDLSPSMDAVDVAPSRLGRARAASAALLRDAAGAQLGLVVFGADAFTVAPLMSDAEPLVHLLGGLATRTVPRAGSRPDLGLDQAREVLARAGAAAGEVILVGDSAGDERTLEAARTLRAAGFPVSVLAVGTPHGGPVRLAGGTFAYTNPNAGTGNKTVTVSGVTVSADATHLYESELHYSLIHAGLSVTLDGKSEQDVTDFVGYESSGDWTMNVYDGAAADEGYWYSWEIAICQD